SMSASSVRHVALTVVSTTDGKWRAIAIGRVGLPRRSLEINRAAEGFLEPARDGHRQVERERHGRLLLEHQQPAGESAPAKALVKGDQRRLADQQTEIDVLGSMQKVQRPLDCRAGESTPSESRVGLDAADAAHLDGTLIPPTRPDDHADVAESCLGGVKGDD